MAAFKLRALTRRLWANSPTHFLLEDGTALEVVRAGVRQPCGDRRKEAKPDCPPELVVVLTLRGGGATTTPPPAPLSTFPIEADHKAIDEVRT